MFLSLRLLFLINLILGMFLGIPIHFSNENNGLQLAYFVNNGLQSAFMNKRFLNIIHKIVHILQQ